MTIGTNAFSTHFYAKSQLAQHGTKYIRGTKTSSKTPGKDTPRCTILENHNSCVCFQVLGKNLTTHLNYSVTLRNWTARKEN